MSLHRARMGELFIKPMQSRVHTVIALRRAGARQLNHHSSVDVWLEQGLRAGVIPYSEKVAPAAASSMWAAHNGRVLLFDVCPSHVHDLQPHWDTYDLCAYSLVQVRICPPLFSNRGGGARTDLVQNHEWHKRWCLTLGIIIIRHAPTHDFLGERVHVNILISQKTINAIETFGRCSCVHGFVTQHVLHTC